MATQQGPTPDDTGLVQFRIHRGARAEAADGLVGTVEQIVVDRSTGELRALVVHSADGRSEFELPAEYVRQSTGDHVYLSLSREQIANNPHLAQPYDPNQYIPVYEGQMEPAPGATELAHETGRPIVTDVETDSAQVVAPVTPKEPPRNQPPLTATQAVLSPNQAQQPGTESGPPSTSGFGVKSIVPPSPAPPMDTSGTERNAASQNAPEQRTTPDNAEERTATPGMYADFTAAPPLDPVAPSAGMLGDTGPLLGKVQPVPSQREVPLTSGSRTPAPPPTPRGDSSQQQTGVSPAAGAIGLAATGLALGAGTGVLIALLRRRSRRGMARDALKRLVDRAQPAGADLAGTVQGTISRAAESVKSAGKSAAATVADAGLTAGASLAAVNWRPRAFRWGLLLGALAGVLFAPRPGRILRAQLAHQLNRLLSRES